MKKGLVLIVCFIILVFGSFSVNAVLGPAPCGPSVPPMECISKNCGTQKCTSMYKAIEEPASAECVQDYSSCAMPLVLVNGCGGGINNLYVCKTTSAGTFESCGSPCTQICQSAVEAKYKEIEMNADMAASGWLNGILSKGLFQSGIVPCTEFEDCMKKGMEKKIIAEESRSRLQKECSSFITKDTYKKLLEFDKSIDKHLDYEFRAVHEAYAETKHQFIDPVLYDKVQSAIQDSALQSKIANSQKWSFSALENVRRTDARLGIKHSFPHKIGTIFETLNQNLAFRWGTRIAGVASTGYGVYEKVFKGGEEDEDQAPFNTNKQMLAQNDWNTAQSAAQNPQIAGDSVWTSCPGHRDGGRCAGQAFCVTDEQGASQCISALPGGGDVTVAFGSIYIIDNIQKNLFTLKGPQNDGVVYQDDGFVNIDKGGTTKISVTGIGALITDFIMNRLFLGRGTTTYLGNGNADAGTYLTNTFILDYSSSVGVDAVNPTEQNRFKEGTQIGNFKQDNELAFTVNQFSLKPYKNAVDIGNLQGQYQILTRGFSNIVLAEKDKIFPLMTRNFAKGDSLIVKNKGVKIPNDYLVNDGNYQYTIKTIGDSTKVLAKNGKVIQDSGPLGSQLSRRQAILVYNV